MRRLLGCLILILGVLGLGLWGRAEHALHIEKDITNRAEGAVASSVHGVETHVSGRDITVSGLADSQAEHDSLIGALEALKGRRVVNDSLTVIESASPYSFGLDKAEGGALANISGYIPTEIARGEVADLIGADAAKGLKLATGAPASGWTTAIGTGLGALSALDSGSMSLTDGLLKISGKAADAETAARVEATLAELPEGYRSETLIDVPVKNIPGDWSLTWTETEGGRIAGSLPAGLDTAALASALGLGNLPGEISQLEASDPAEATAGLGALTALAPSLPDLSAFSLSMRGLEAQADVTARPGADLDAIRGALAAALPGNAAINLVAALPAPDYRISYDAAQGATLSGAVPDGLDADSVAKALGLGSVAADVTQASGGEEASKTGLNLLAKFRGWLPQIEKLGLTMGAKPAADMVLGAGSDAELVQGSLAEALGGAVALNVATAPAETMADGAERVNAATGETERFFGGFWLPRRDFTVSTDTCNGMAQDILDRLGIGFVTGSARLNAEAAQAVNELAAVMGPCAQAGLKVELGGHTDSTGDAELNRKLSQDRAQAVYDALARRGVDTAAMTAMGYGDSLPIADNGTEDGRAQNRRTTIVWTE